MVPQPSSTQWAKPVKHSAGAFPHRPVLWRPLPYLGVLSSLPPVPRRISTSTALQKRLGKPRRLVPASSAGGKSAHPARQRCVLCILFLSCESLLHGGCPLQLTVRDSGPPRVGPSLRPHQIPRAPSFPASFRFDCGKNEYRFRSATKKGLGTFQDRLAFDTKNLARQL